MELKHHGNRSRQSAPAQRARSVSGRGAGPIDGLLALHSTAGNRAVQRLLEVQRSPCCPACSAGAPCESGAASPAVVQRWADDEDGGLDSYFGGGEESYSWGGEDTYAEADQAYAGFEEEEADYGGISPGFEEMAPDSDGGDRAELSPEFEELAPENRTGDPEFEDLHVPHMIEGTSCTPYESSIQAGQAWARMMAVLPPAALAATGSATNARVWVQYLQGGGRVAVSDTNDPGDALVESVRNDEGQVDSAVEAILASVEARIEQLAHERLRGRDEVDIPIEEIVPPALLHPRLEWIRAFSPAGNVIGEIGASDIYGRDTRAISGTIHLVKQRRRGDALTVDVRASCDLTVRVLDTADFCPGNIGPVWEQNLTIPLSRLEASGWAGDVQVDVTVHEHRSTGLHNMRDPDVEG